jgi:hypothetical protein
MPDRTGLYRSSLFVYLTDGKGARSTLSEHEYVRLQCKPPIAELMDEMAYHEKSLALEIRG